MNGTDYNGFAAGYGGTGQAMNGNGYGYGGPGQAMNGNGDGRGVGLEGREVEYGQGGGGGYGQDQPPTFQQSPYVAPWAPGYLPRAAAYPNTPHGYGGPIAFQPVQQKYNNCWDGGGGGGVGGGGGGIQGGPAVDTGQVPGGGRRVDIFDQEDLPPVMNVQQIPQPLRLSKKYERNGSRQDWEQNPRPGRNNNRYISGPGGHRTQTSSQEETDNV